MENLDLHFARPLLVSCFQAVLSWGTKTVTIHHAMKRRNVYPESGDTIPIQKTKTNGVMSPVSYQLIRYAIPAQTQSR